MPGLRRIGATSRCACSGRAATGMSRRFFECFGCSVMFRDPVSFSGMRFHGPGTDQMVPEGAYRIRAMKGDENEG